MSEGTGDFSRALGVETTGGFKLYDGFDQLMPVTLNTSGITPLAFKVLILPDPVEEKTAGGIIIPIEKVTKDEFATTSGTVVAIASAAFSHVTEAEWDGQKPQVGDRVIYTKYAGFRREGKDGKDYLIVKDEDIHAKL